MDDLTVDQRLELEEVLAGRPPRAAVTAVIETSPGDERRCPHCGHGASVGCGQADGLRRFRCKGCGRSFNALTGTSLARLRKKACWLRYGEALAAGADVVVMAAAVADFRPKAVMEEKLRKADGVPEVVANAGQRVYAWKGDGTPVAGWPVLARDAIAPAADGCRVAAMLRADVLPCR